jgi:hemolysin III
MPAYWSDERVLWVDAGSTIFAVDRPVQTMMLTPIATGVYPGAYRRARGCNRVMKTRAVMRAARAAVRKADNCMYHGEKLNAITHLVAAVLALVGAVVLVVLAALGGDPWKVVSVSIYGLTLVLLYTFSVLYHSLRGRAKVILQKLDHQSIYLLIAGSYTPFCLVTLRGGWGWSLFGVVWGLAVIGSLQEFWADKARILSVVIYLVMGWAVVVALVPLHKALGPAGFAWLVAGGLFYTLGIVFYALDARVTHFHGVWHLFVMAGSAAHYVAILFYVI